MSIPGSAGLAYCAWCSPAVKVEVTPGGLVICPACEQISKFGADLVARRLTEAEALRMMRKPMGWEVKDAVPRKRPVARAEGGGSG